MPVYKDKERGTWYASFYYTDWQGHRRLKKKRGFARKKDAEDFEREFLLAEARSCDMTFGSLVEIYREDMRPRLRRNTMQTKESVLDLWVIPYFKDLPVNKITTTTIRAWQAEVLKHKVSPSYARTINSQLAAVLNYAVRFYKLPKSPTKDAGSMGKKKTAPMDFWTVDEFNRFIQCVPNFSAEVGFSVLFWTGMRISELLALTLSDVDFERSTIRVEKGFHTIEGETVIDDPKTDKGTRHIDISPKLADLLRRYVDGLYKPEPGDRLFPYTKSAFYSWMKKGCDRSGVKKIRVHDLRHSHASWLINKRYPIIMISERLGHEDVQTTLRVYGHLYNQTTAEAVAEMDDEML